MPRPLYIFKSVVEQDSTITLEKINNLLGEIVVVSDKAHKCLAECIKLLTAKDSDSDVDAHIVDLGVRMWNDFKVTGELVKKGFYLQSMMVIRDAVETIALAEYLHDFPDKANAWWKAKTKRERLRFSLNNIKDDIVDGQSLKELWDMLSSYIHTNSKAVPAYGADKPYYGHNLFLNGFYYPSSVEFLFTLRLDLCIEFLKEWSTQHAYEIYFKNGIAPAGPLKRKVRSKYPLADKVNKEAGEAVDRRVYTPELYDAIAVAVQGIFSGDLTPEEAMNQVQKVSDEVYGR